MMEQKKVQSTIERNEHDVQRFVLDFLRMCGARVTQEGKTWRAHIPSNIAKELSLPQRLRFTFIRQHADEQTHLFASGSAWLDSMIAYARKSGKVSSFLFSNVHLQKKIAILCQVEPWKQPDEVPSEALKAVEFSNGRVRRTRRRVLYQEEMYFHFTVSFVSDERIESCYVVAVDPLTERAIEPLDLDKALFLPLPALFSTGRSGEEAAVSYVTKRQYEIACKHLEKALAPELAKRTADSERRLQEEKRRVDTYYRHAAQEAVQPLRRQMRKTAALHLRTQGTYHNKSMPAESMLHRMVETMYTKYENELTGLEIDRKRRLRELEQRYHVEVEVKLTNVACVRVPRIEWTLTFDTSSVDVQFLHDILRDRVIDFECALCSSALTRVTVCSCGNVLCVRCTSCCHGTLS